MRSVVCVLSSFSQLGIHWPKEIEGEESPSGKNYGQLGQSSSKLAQQKRDLGGKFKWTENQAGRNVKIHSKTVAKRQFKRLQ